jgi:hypothetical protein
MASAGSADWPDAGKKSTLAYAGSTQRASRIHDGMSQAKFPTP